MTSRRMRRKKQMTQMGKNTNAYGVWCENLRKGTAGET
jgi:hypothetical protein